MPLRLLALEGPDHGQGFVLPESGTVRVGNRQKFAELCLQDSYIGRVHCELAITGQEVMVRHGQGHSGTLINGQKIQEQALHVGDVLRVGNSQLRLELVDASVLSAGGSVLVTAAGMTRSPLEKLEQLGGHTLGHFELEQVLGRGRSGVVFRARDNKREQPVALKVLAEDFPANDTEMQTFIQATKTRVGLAHPSLVTVYGAGKSGSCCWLAAADSPENTLRQIREVLPAKPKKYEKSIPDAFQALVLRMLAKRPEERYATPGAMLADLAKIRE